MGPFEGFERAREPRKIELGCALAASLLNLPKWLAGNRPAASQGLPCSSYNLFRRPGPVASIGNHGLGPRPDRHCWRNLSAWRPVDTGNRRTGCPGRGVDRLIALPPAAPGNVDSHLPRNPGGERRDARPWSMVDRCTAVRKETVGDQSNPGKETIPLNR